MAAAEASERRDERKSWAETKLIAIKAGRRREKCMVDVVVVVWFALGWEKKMVEREGERQE